MAQLEILGTEVLTPMADAMWLVDRERPDIERAEEFLEAVGGQTLGRHEEQPQSFLARRPHHLALLDFGRRAVDLTRVDVELAESVDLVLHERDERRHDDRQLSRQ